MISPERFVKALIKFFFLFILPLIVIFGAAYQIEVMNPDTQPVGLLPWSNILSEFWRNIFINALPGLLFMTTIPFVIVWYVNRLYRLKGRGLSFFLRNVLGTISSKPFLVIKEGRIAGDESSPLARIGGPGLLVIYNSNAVVTERKGRLKRVLGPGYSRLEHFERIYDIIDLRPQNWKYTVGALTRDGIPISCDADVSFKIDDRVDGEPIPPSKNMPYPFTEDAVLKAALATWIREEDREDQVMKWTGRVIISNTEGTLRSILARYRLDQLVFPDQPTGNNKTREEICEQLERALESSAPAVGARILSVDIGAIEVKVDLPEGEEEAAAELTDEVVTQWIRAWQAELERHALVERAEGEASLVSLEAVSVQAQAEMVLTLTEAMQSLVRAEDTTAYERALRLIETLRWMTFDPNIRAFMPLEPLRFLKRLQDIVEQDRPLSDGKRKILTQKEE